MYNYETPQCPSQTLDFTTDGREKGGINVIHFVKNIDTADNVL